MEFFVKENKKEKRRSTENTGKDNQDSFKGSRSTYSLQKRHSLGSSTHFEEWKSHKEFHRERLRLQKKRSAEKNLQEVPKILSHSRKLAEKQIDPEYRPKTYINSQPEPEQPKTNPFPIKNSLKRMNNFLPMRLDVSIKPLNVIVSSPTNKAENFKKLKLNSYPKDFKRRISLLYDLDSTIAEYLKPLDEETVTMNTRDTVNEALSPSFTHVSYAESHSNWGFQDKMIPSISLKVLKN